MGDKANRLIDENSPYLLLHAFNPVDWYPWGYEPFARAKRENKPIFLSIGYSTCHWCHVMAHESFENPEIAAILNRWFICIKVDREERPDIDQMYMAATQAMTGSGGWPMSLFLLADGSPFYAGTYFPPSSSFQRPGFSDLLTAIHKVWTEQPEKLKETANQMVAALDASNRSTGKNAQDNGIQPDVAEQCFTLLAGTFDAKDGGFGQAPKFPRPVLLSFLFSHYRATQKPKALKMALLTLDKMGSGGMYDQLGGGFHRYSVDQNWFVPHFEKMLYDQAQLAQSYLDGFQITGEHKYAALTEEIFTYVLRDMRDPAGGFYSAEDADSENPYEPGKQSEGAFYLWHQDEITGIIDIGAAKIFNYAYGVKAGGNVGHDPMKEFTGMNILSQTHTLDETARHVDMDLELVKKSLATSRATLFDSRDKRKRPHLDDKVITAWNGMMIGALARGNRLLQKPQLLDAANKCALFIQKNLYNSDDHSLQRRYRLGDSGLAGQLDDYAFLTAGLLKLYQAGQDPQWLKMAVDLTKKQIELFWHEEAGNSFFYDSVADPSVKVRMKAKYDGAEPAGNSVAALNLLRLGQLQDNNQWQTMARDLILSFASTLNRYPPALPLMLTAWQQTAHKPTQVIIAGTMDGADTKELRRIVDQFYDPSMLVLLAENGPNQHYLAQKLPFLQTVSRLEGKATAYVCYDFTCQQPTTDPSVLRQQLLKQQDVK